MKKPSALRNNLAFFQHFFKTFKTTGSILPSSRFLAAAMTRPLKQRSSPKRVLEIGPGTGAVTAEIVKHLGPDDHFDLVELNEDFVNILKHRFETEPAFQNVKDRSAIHSIGLEEFQTASPYDVIISGLPHVNFPADLVAQLFDRYFELLAPDGTLSYFEYMFIRPLRTLTPFTKERRRITAINQIVHPLFARNRFRRDWVFANFPPAWVQHLKPTTQPPQTPAD